MADFCYYDTVAIWNKYQYVKDINTAGINLGHFVKAGIV